MIARVWLVALLLLVSGSCALVYQVAWLREFRLIFGGSTTASAAVLAVFMGGLGLGNWLLGRAVEAQPAPLMFYARLEIAIATLCAVSPFLLDFTQFSYILLGGQESLGASGATALRLLMTVLVIGAPTLLMGGTLPAAAKTVVSASDVQRRGLGLVYGANTIGAVHGTLVSTFVLLPTLGTRTTLWLACAVNLLLGVSVLLIASDSRVPARREKKRAERAERKQKSGSLATSATKHVAAAEPALESPAQRPPAALVYATAFIVGCAFFIMELVWYRMLTPLLGGSTYTFGLILAVALAGIGIGGACYPLLYRQRLPRAADFALTCALQAAVMAIPFALGDRLAIFASVRIEEHVHDFAALVRQWTLITSIVIFPAALIAGLQFPLLISLLGRGDEQVARQAGAAFGANTLGCIVGSLLGGFGLLPLLSAPGVWSAVVLTMALTAIVWWWPVYRGRQRGDALRLAASAVAASAAIIMLWSIGPTAVWRHSTIGAGRSRFHELNTNDRQKLMHGFRRTLIWQADGVESSLGIRCGSSYAVYVNGKSDGDVVGDASTQIMLGMVGAALHERPRDALVIGLGTGETAGWIAACDEVERVDVVELEPQMRVMAELCKVANHDVLHNPKVSLIINDARETLTTTRRTYDLIVSEPSNPYRAGVATLFTREFYAAARARLNAGGIFGQWLQSYEVNAETIAIVLATLRSEFPHVELWQLKHGDLLLLGSAEPLRYDAAQLRAKLAREPYKSALRVSWRSTGLEALLAGYVGGDELTAELAARGAGQTNTDDHNRLEYAFAKTVGTESRVDVAEWRSRARELGDHRPAIAGDVDWERALDVYLLMYVRDKYPPPILPGMTPDQAIRRRALTEHVNASTAEDRATARERHRAAVELWFAQPRAPRESSELAAVCISLLHLRDPRIVPLIDQLRALEPAEADVLAALWAYEKQNRDAAAQYLERAILAFRDDPWPNCYGNFCKFALVLAEDDPKYVPRFYAALNEPFAAGIHHEERTGAALILAEKLGGPQLVAHLETLEPHIPWSEAFLRLRAETYAAAQHPLEVRSRRQLAQFLEQK